MLKGIHVKDVLLLIVLGLDVVGPSMFQLQQAFNHLNAKIFYFWESMEAIKINVSLQMVSALLSKGLIPKNAVAVKGSKF
jgi:hypothetical protein